MSDHGEEYFSLREARNRFPGCRPDLSTIYRWVKTGARGRRLITIRVGGRRYLTQAHIEQFVREDQPPAAACEANHVS